MPVDHEDMIQRSYRGFRERDEDALLAVYHPEMVWDMTGWSGWPEDPIYQGHEGLRGVLRFVWEVNETWDVHTVEIVPLGSDRYFVRGEVRLTSPRGLDYQPPAWGQIVSFRDGLISRVEQYRLADDALRAAGLEP